jgi:hypothetical protein
VQKKLLSVKNKMLEGRKLAEYLAVLHARRARIKQRMIVKMNWQEEAILRHELIDVDFQLKKLKCR